MPKHKLPRPPKLPAGAPAPPDLRQQGLRAFQGARFDAAIAAWTSLAARDPKVAAALAEAYFRRALTRGEVANQVADLRRALTLNPAERRYQYHLGLALHRAGDRPAAVAQYRALLAADPRWPGAGLALALAALEENPRVDLAALPGSSEAIRATLAPVQALLRGSPPPARGDAPLDQFWQGLGQIQARDPAARDTLADQRPLPSAQARVLRHYYHGVAAALAGEPASAVPDLEQAYQEGLTQRWLFDNLAAGRLARLLAQQEAGDLTGAALTAESARPVAGSNVALAEALVQTLDRAAQAAAAAGDWARAVTLWDGARQIVAGVAGLGSPRPLLHNLALAYEMQEQWVEAAETWRAMLRTRPRKSSRAAAAAAAPAGSDGGEAGAEMTEPQWAWVRKRVITCYKEAGLPGEAVTVFRQAIKADPDDLDTRLELVDALLGDEREQAALNELQRILQIDPAHVEAQLRLGALQTERGEWWLAEDTLRRLLAQAPEREDVRRQVAQLLLQRGDHMQSVGLVLDARNAFEEGAQLAPTDYHFPLGLARLAIDRQDVEAARLHLERVLALGDERPDAYLAVLDAWAVLNRIAEVRAVLARAEAGLTLTPDFYTAAGIQVLKRQTAPPAPSFLGLLAPPRPAPADDPAWLALAGELLQRGLALRPDDAHLRFSVAAELLKVRPDLALPYAEEAARLLPDEPNGLMLLGLLQALTEHKREAKDSLRRATRLARQQGNTAVLRAAEELRRLIDNPMLPLMLQLGPLFGGMDEDDEF